MSNKTRTRKHGGFVPPHPNKKIKITKSRSKPRSKPRSKSRSRTISKTRSRSK